MKLRIATALLIIVAILLILDSAGVQAQTYTQYKIQVNSDGSAAWVITQATSINGTVDTWQGFQDKVTGLVAAASTLTNRSMNVDSNSLQMSTTTSVSSESKTTEYLFTWLNFSETSNGQLMIGDVFGVSGFFDMLYGDGALQIIIPQIIQWCLLFQHQMKKMLPRRRCNGWALSSS